MNRFHTVIAVAFLASLLANNAPAEQNWTHWRGPTFNGVAAEGQQPAVRWTSDQNILWKTSVAGRGHSSPVIVGNQIFLTSADKADQVQAVLAFDRSTGKSSWATMINRGGLPKKIHSKNTHATPSVTSDGQRLFAVFCNHDQVQLAALDLQGKLLWKIVAGGYLPKKYTYGFAPSPVLYKNSVIVASDYDGSSFLAAFDKETGKELWRKPRQNQVSWASPIVGHVAGKDQLLVSGCNQVVAYDPNNGTQLWKCAGPASATCGTLVWEGDLVFASGGYPQKETLAVKADGSGEIVWRNREKAYEQSLLAHDGYLYAVTDGGIALCWAAKTGKEMWKKRLAGPVSASPILAGGNIYLSNEKGATFVFRANPAKFELLATNQLGDETFATFAICDSRIYLRAAKTTGGKRQETLYCIGSR